MKFSKNVNNKKHAPKMIFFNENFFWKDSDNFWHRQLTLKVGILQFLTTFIQVYTRPKGLEYKGRACKICESVRQKLGHTITFMFGSAVDNESIKLKCRYCVQKNPNTVIGSFLIWKQNNNKKPRTESVIWSRVGWNNYFTIMFRIWESGKFYNSLPAKFPSVGASNTNFHFTDTRIFFVGCNTGTNSSWNF